MAATGSSPLVPSNNEQIAPNASVSVTYDSGGSGTYSVSYTIDDLNQENPVSLSQTTTVVTLTDNRTTGHGLRVGDEVVVQGSGIPGADGSFVVATVTSPTVLTYANATSQTAASNTAKAAYLKMTQLTAQKTQTTASWANYPFPVSAFRLDCGVAGAGNARMRVTLGMGR